jgi:hypothetical protein
MKTSSQGLIPFIELNNFVVEDSQKCVEYLSEIYEKDMNSSLTDEQRAVGQAVTKMVEERYSIIYIFFIFDSCRLFK